MERNGFSAQQDLDLVQLARNGSSEAFGELWRRHAPAVLTAVRHFTGFDPDDVVQETFIKVLQQIRAGGGPETAFRTYAIMTARHVAVNLARKRSSSEITGNDDQIFEAHSLQLPGSDGRFLESEFVQQVFRSLPHRWQEVLWYREVEGLQVRELCGLLGMTENSASVLLKRAREGFKQAWILANLEPETELSPGCQRAIQKIPQLARGKASPKTERELALHFETCPRCSALYKESEHVEHQLALALLPLIFTSVGVAGSFGWLGIGNTAQANAGTSNVSAAVTTTPGSSSSVSGGLGAFKLAQTAAAPLAVLAAGALVASIGFAQALQPADSTQLPGLGGHSQTGAQSAPPSNRAGGSGEKSSSSDDRSTEQQQAPNVVGEQPADADEQYPQAAESTDASDARKEPEAPSAEALAALSAAPADGAEVGVYPRLSGVGAPNATVQLSMVNQRGQTAEYQLVADAWGRWSYTPTELMGQVSVSGYQVYSYLGHEQRDAPSDLGTYEVGYGLDLSVQEVSATETIIRVGGLSSPTKNQVVNIVSTQLGALATHQQATGSGEVVLTLPYPRAALGDLRYWQGDTSEGPQRTWWRML